MKKISKIKLSSMLISLVLIFISAGCATITQGTNEVLVIDSVPSNALVKLSNGMIGYTPATFTVARDSVLTCTIEKEGYKPYSIEINHQISAHGHQTHLVYNHSHGLAGFIFRCVDNISGATQELIPNPVFAELEPISCVFENLE